MKTKKKKSLHRILSICLLSIICTASTAATIIKNPKAVAPFQLCFSNQDGTQSWSAASHGSGNALVSIQQHFPFCLNQNLSIHHYLQLTPFEKDFFVAVAMWQSYFNSNHAIIIKAMINQSRTRFGGNTVLGKTVKKDGISIVYPRALTTLLGEKTWQSARFSRALLENKQHADILVSINPRGTDEFSNTPYCVDLTPTGPNRHCSPNKNVRDLGSVLLHELGHGYGIRSLRSHRQANYGNFSRNRVSAFDFQTNNDSQYPGLMNNYQRYFINDRHPIIFTGNSTQSYLKQIGLPALKICNITPGQPLFSQNFSHLCYTSCQHPADNMNKPDLMGMWCLWKDKQTRLQITSLDLHILYDIGYAPVLKTTSAIPDLREKLFTTMEKN